MLAKKLFACSCIIFFFALSKSFAQSKAKAVMNVTATVITDSKINIDQQKAVKLSKTNSAVIGHINVNHTKPSTTIEVSKKVRLWNGKGQESWLHIQKGDVIQAEANKQLTLQGRADKDIPEGFYKGELTTTINYN